MGKKPSGFIAICQCGAIIGVIDIKATDRKEAGNILGEWLMSGCAIEPKFGSDWRTTVTQCTCADKQCE